jgi:hypothetical protein
LTEYHEPPEYIKKDEMQINGRKAHLWTEIEIGRTISTQPPEDMNLKKGEKLNNKRIMDAYADEEC